MENKPAIIQSWQEGVKTLAQSKSVRKLFAGVIAAGLLTGGVAMCARHYEHTREEEAQNRLIAREAQKRNVVLMDESKIPAIVADAIGYPEDDIDFREIELKNRPLPPRPGEPREGKQRAFRPVYKIKCVAHLVKYKLRLDAISGEVLHCEVDD